MKYIGQQLFEWLYKYSTEKPRSREQWEFQKAAEGLPIIGNFIAADNSARDYGQYWQDYLDSRGLDWSDVKYPSMLASGQISRGASGFNMVSKNLTKLYR